MQTILGQILAGTRLDLQGERNSKEVLERYAAAYAQKRLPLNQQHDLALPTIGYAENLRVVPDEKSPGDWSLIADVTLTAGASWPRGGFSFSYMEQLRPSRAQELIQVLLPYPHYHDAALIDEVFEDGYVSVGRIVRKGATPETIALIVGVAVAVLQPLWEDVYRTKIAPAVVAFFRTRFGTLAQKNISCNFMQHLDYSGHIAQVVFIPPRGREVECLSVDHLMGGMLQVSDYLNALDINHVPVTRVVLNFEQASSRYQISSVQLADGTVESGA